jgi:hypothetical protein
MSICKALAEAGMAGEVLRLPEAARLFEEPGSALEL